MDILVLLSLLIKGLGSILEIASQSLISQKWGVEIYGTYAFFIAVSEVTYFLLFSGIVKFNNYYIPHNQDVSRFKKKLYKRLVLPISFVGIAIGFGLANPLVYCAFFTALLYFFAMDASSTQLSFGYYKAPLIGEYCIGRLFVIVGILGTLILPEKNIVYLYVIYGLQFIVITSYLKLCVKKQEIPALSIPLEKKAIKKYVIFQVNEIANMIIMQSTVIIQYLLGGAFQTAIVSIILVIRKIINFITGPASKLYQPEFSKRFNEGNKKSLAKVYAQITRMQLCFILPLFTFLIVRPDFVLSIYNDSLCEYESLVRYTSIVFLFMVAFGPLANFLCMTNHEKTDTATNWVSIIIMYAVMFATKESPYFVIYGFCTQIVTSTIFKLYVFIHFMKCFTMPVNTYLRLLGVLAFTVIVLLTVKINILVCLAICILQFVANFIFAFPRIELVELLKRIKR